MLPFVLATPTLASSTRGSATAETTSTQDLSRRQHLSATCYALAQSVHIAVLETDFQYILRVDLLKVEDSFVIIKDTTKSNT